MIPSQAHSMVRREYHFNMHPFETCGYKEQVQLREVHRFGVSRVYPVDPAGDCRRAWGRAGMVEMHA